MIFELHFHPSCLTCLVGWSWGLIRWLVVKGRTPVADFLVLSVQKTKVENVRPVGCVPDLQSPEWGRPRGLGGLFGEN